MTAKKGAKRTMLSTRPVYPLQQQQQLPPADAYPARRTNVEVRLCVPEDQQAHLPKRRRAPTTLPTHAPLPRQGEVIYLSSSSAWGVELVIHEWLSPVDLRVEVWITHVGSSRQRRPTGFQLTQ